MFTSKKNRTSNRILALALVLCMVVGMFTMAASAEETAVVSAQATESVSVTENGFYPVEFTLTNPTDADYSVTLEKISGAADLYYQGTTEVNGAITLAAYTEVAVSGNLYISDVETQIEDVYVDVLAGDEILSTVMIAVETPHELRAISYTFDSDAEGFSGSYNAEGYIYKSNGGGTNSTNTVMMSSDRLVLTTGNLYRLSLKGKANTVFGNQTYGFYAQVRDYDANGNLLAQPYSLNGVVGAMSGGDFEDYSFNFVSNAIGNPSYAYSTIAFSAGDEHAGNEGRCQICVDDVLLVDYGAADMFDVPNNSFEDYEAAYFDTADAAFGGWSGGLVEKQGTTAECWSTAPLATPYEGKEMLAVTTDYSVNGLTNYNTEETVTISAWVTDRSRQGDRHPRASVSVYEIFADGTITQKELHSNNLTSDMWASICATYKKPDDVVSFRIGFGSAGANGYGFVDYVTMYESGVIDTITAEDIAAADPIEIYQEAVDAPEDVTYKAAYYGFDSDAEGWTGPMMSYKDSGSIYIGINGGSGAAAATIISPDELKLTTGNLYRLDFTATGNKVFAQNMAARAMICDYDADGNALTQPYSLNELCLLDGTAQDFSCYFVANVLNDKNYAYSKISFCARNDNYDSSVVYRQQMLIDDVLLVDAGKAQSVEVPNGNFETLGADGFAAGKQGFTHWSTNTMASQGTTQAAGPSSANYYTAFEGAEMMNIMPGAFIKYNSTSFTEPEQVVINAWIKYAAWRDMGLPTFTLHVSETDQDGNSNVQTIGTSIFCYPGWMNVQGVYVKPASAAYFNVGVDVSGTEWVGTFVDHVTMHKSAAATTVTPAQISAAEKISGFNGDLPVYSIEVPEMAAPVVTELDRPEVEEPEVPATPVTIAHKGNNLSLEGIVYINQYATITDAESIEFVEANGGLLIWNEEPAEADIATADVVKAGLTYDTSLQAYGQTSDGIPAKEFADELYMAIYVEYAEGQYSYGPVKAYSVQAYCESRLEKSTNEKMKALAAQMLHYGAAAQTYFRYNTDDLANANITVPADEWDAGLLDEVVAYTSAPTSTGDVTIVGKNLSLEGTVLVNYYFNPATDWTVASGKLQVWQDTTELSEDNVAYEVDMTYGQVTSTTWGWGGQSEGVVAKEYGKTTYARAVLTDTEGNEHTSDIITYSPEEYAKGRINKSTDANMVNLAKQLVMYGERARLYFG